MKLVQGNCDRLQWSLVKSSQSNEVARLDFLFPQFHVIRILKETFLHFPMLIELLQLVLKFS